MVQASAQDLDRPLEGLHLLRRGAIPFMPGLRPLMDRFCPSLGPRLAQKAHNLLVVVAGIRGAHRLQPPGAGLTYIHCALQHALAQEACSCSILDGLGGQFACLHHSLNEQVLKSLSCLIKINYSP